MIYAMSDLHGCYEKYKKILEIIDLQPEDRLYVLGDVVDRGEGGIEILKDMCTRQNVIPLRGNHDFMAYRLLRQMYTLPTVQILMNEQFERWTSDGGDTTLKAFLMESKEEQKALLRYLDSFWLYDEITVNGQKYFLSHTVPEKEIMLDFSKCSINDFLYGEPEYEKTYFDDKIIVTGHTPTKLISIDSAGKIYKGNNHIAIDCGAVFGAPLGCIRLDDGKEFYAEIS